jgi:hypothetical protein
MPNPMIDATLTEQDVENVIATFKTVREQLDFLAGLSAPERRQISKMGRKAQTFTARALDMAA